MGTKDLSQRLEELFDAERAVRAAHAELSAAPEGELLEVVSRAAARALEEENEEEATLRLVRVATLLGELEGPRVVDTLIDILGSEHPEARHAAGEELEALAFERFREVADGVERALGRLRAGSPALPELPYLLAEVPEPGVTKLLARFLEHADADAVAAGIEALAEIGDPSSARALERLIDDKRTVEMMEEGGEEAAEVTIGELATEALSLVRGDASDGPSPRRGGAS